MLSHFKNEQSDEILDSLDKKFDIVKEQLPPYEPKIKVRQTSFFNEKTSLLDNAKESTCCCIIA